MIRFRRLFCLLLLTVSLAASGQYTKEFKRLFLDADYLYQAGFYEEAFNRYKNLLTLDPGNSNILFHCGACCLNIPGNEQLAITYLRDAIPGVTENFRDRSHKEPGAPVITYYMLGRAYHLNNEFDQAVENYQFYISAGVDEDPLQLDYAGLQIEACKRAARVVVERPSFEFQSVLDQFDEELPSCSNPVISGDGNILIFLVDYPSDKKIMMTTRTGNLWSRPRVINSEIGMVGETYPVCLSYDGKDLYFVHQFLSHSDIFVSRFEGGRWSEARVLGPNINGRTSENHASISKDGKTLYFTSDARGGLGSFDIYVSRLDNKGEWGLPTNLGPVINTPYEEHTPFISSNDSILFFSSQGHASIGGLDNFYSKLGADGSWSEPANLGVPVNTTGEDVFFNPGWDELDGYYAVRREDDPTSNTINMVIELEPEEVVAEAEQGQVSSETEPFDPAASGVHLRVPAKPEPEEEKPPATVIEAIEPEETDRIVEVLNKEVKEATVEPGKPAAPVKPEPEAWPAEFHTSVHFDHNDFKLDMAAMLEAEKIGDLMAFNPDTRVELTGYADATGSKEYNLLLSLQRAEQIARYLEKRGIERSRITLDGKGEANPIARNQYPDGKDAPLGRYLNRQVRAKVTGQTALPVDLAGQYVPLSLLPDKSETGELNSDAPWLTIQIRASKSPSALSRFSELTGVQEFTCRDHYYRYTFGEYRTFLEARDQLRKLHEMGYKDAFIQTLDWYERATK